MFAIVDRDNSIVALELHGEVLAYAKAIFSTIEEARRVYDSLDQDDYAIVPVEVKLLG